MIFRGFGIVIFTDDSAGVSLKFTGEGGIFPVNSARICYF